MIYIMTGGDPELHRYGCFLSDLTGFTAVPPATSQPDYGIREQALQ
jgi:hypothetical protein